jgi:Arc/MetJ family transcription regulator
MRTTIEIGDDLLAAAMVATGLPTKGATVEEALRCLVRLHGQIETPDDLAGIGWDDGRMSRTGKAQSEGDDGAE